ncbi:protein chiffon isoform X2 [Drosophila sulfurigaster albostrigata]|uniref:protein chiffon isoform X2 n=1 Tax=Drosophila sulfurigaster albostrigata TaxID=89887 RepID=UPI002D21A2B4|nr:protein chiffon isoform X2 [Drosophila sulfurigaster albostrigata]
MQPHLDKQSAINSKLSTTAATTTRRETPEQQHQQQPQPEPQPHSQPPQRSKVKVIKSKRPLCHFKFYLDIRDHQLTKRIESEIKALGGNLEFFLNDSITHFITDKERSTTSSAVAAVVAPNSRSQHQQQRPATPLTPATPNTPQSQASATIGNEDGSCSTSYPRKVRQTRADAILSRVREAQQQSQQSPLRGAIELTHQQPPGKSLSYVVWQTEYALRFFRRIQTELRQYLQEGAVTTTTAAGTANILLKGSYIKIESIKRNHRPYYHLLKQPEEWPKIDLSSDDGAFRLQAKAKLLEQSMTRKSLGSRTSQRQQEKHKEQQTVSLPQQPQLVVLQHSALQACKKQTESPDRSHCRELKESSDKQCGVCEICKIEYDTLSIHLQSKDHELFAKNSGNFVALDTLIEVSASVKGFLQREAEQEQKEREQQQQQQKIFTDMEVDELLSDSALALSLKAAINQTDADALQQTLSSGNNNNSNRQRPSPVLREKSKRITKGKHSSEKFQATTPNNSPTTAATTSNPAPAATTVSPTKRGTTTTSCNLLELHASNATTTAATPTNPTRRKTNNSVLSPPIRAMLPPSSLYKVVEASDATATPPRVRRGGVNNATTNLDSPSLIVKFQKVRQSELQRLNGEAENFMFPRSNTATTRSSSELLTDVDRQTTSDVVRGGQHSVSSSTNSTNDSTSEEQLDAALAAGAGVATTPALVQGRAAVVGRRRKGVAAAQQLLSTGSTSSSNGSNNQHQQQQQQQQRFPNAPIQPEMQPLKQPRQATAATRKSSRMATAIVTAATTSSQLQLRRQRGGNKLEDRMGEQQQQQQQQPQQEQTTTNHKKLIAAQQQQQEEDEHMEVEIEEDVEEMMMSHDESSCSSGSDEDYVASSKLHKSLPATSQRAADTREERAARRLSRLTLSTSRNELQRVTPLKCGRRGKQKLNAVKNSKLNKPQLITAAAITTTTPATPTATSPTKKTAAAAAATSPSSEQMFDCSKSVRLQRMRYAFETSPSAELWHHVFQRQDAGEEHYYSYYGSTRYRKLPYEMGPIPMERTKPHSCSICQQQQQQQQQVECKPQALLQPIKVERDAETDSNQTAATTTTTTTSSMYKHKKLHLLQRYQQEQQQQQTQLNNIAVPIAKCDSKASTPELLERDFAPLSERGQLVERVRAASTQSSTSSTSCSQKSSSINKQLARVVDLPPRKSPREHASTLALVSCIIRQRQDSQSKTNSEAEEPPPPTTAPPPPVVVKKPIKQELVEAVTPHKTRSQAATPVEELRFATEISETVKRMRRGQNKYDSVPTPTTPAAERTTPARCRRPANNNSNNNNEVNMANTLSYSRRTTTATTTTTSTLLGKRKRRQLGMKTTGGRGTTSGQQQHQQQSHQQLLPGIRKLPSKKGLLEYEMEGSALKALDASMQYVSPMLIAWQIDKYLELTGRDYDLQVDDEVQQQQQQPESNVELRDDVVQTPPPTDCFTSEFDLCDLLAGSGGSGDDDEFAVRTGCRRNSRLNLFSSYQRKRKCLKSNRTGWPRVQRRRAARSLPHNDDAPINFHELGVFDDAKQQQQQRVKQEPLEMEEEQTTATTATTTTTTTSTTKVAEKEIIKEQDDDDNDESAAHGKADGDDDDGEQSAREDVVMTPPATDVDEQLGNDDDDEEVEAEEEEEAEAAAASDEDDDETMADSVEEQQNDEAEIEATDADVEEDEDDEEDEDEEQDEQEDEPEEEQDDEEEEEAEEEDVYEDAYGDEEVSTTTTTHEQQLTLQNLNKSRLKSKSPTTKRDSLAKTAEQSPAKEEQRLLTLQTSNGFCLNVTTSTPSTRQPRHRTPQLNGSLGSCISPSEKLGDNSDIFTVSSDGLETDMDLSNTQAGDSLEHCQHQHQHLTPTKHKFDISKYAPPNNGKAASSCAAEAATAAVKSLAISQFLKKEVRVTCRRLRAPFRRFRYRR